MADKNSNKYDSLDHQDVALTEIKQQPNSPRDTSPLDPRLGMSSEDLLQKDEQRRQMSQKQQSFAIRNQKSLFGLDDLFAPEELSDSYINSKRKQQCTWRVLKFMLSPLVLLFLPFLTLDTFIEGRMGADLLILFWYFLDSSSVQRSVTYQALKENWRWLLVIPFTIFVLGFPVGLVVGLYSYHDNIADARKIIVRAAFLIPSSVFAILIVFFTFKNKDYSQLDYPSAAVRWRHPENLIALLLAVYDAATMTSLTVRPDVKALDTSGISISNIFSVEWQSLKIPVGPTVFWVSVGLACAWIVLALYCYYWFDVRYNATRILGNKKVSQMVELLANNGFLFITVNLMKGLDDFTLTNEHDPDYDSCVACGPGYSQTYRRAINVLSLTTLFFYLMSSLYGASIDARSDNAFADKDLDLRYTPSYQLMEKFAKMLLCALNVFTRSESTQEIYLSLIPSAIISFLLALTSIRSRPCSVQAYNVVNFGKFMCISWAAVCSFVALVGYPDEDHASSGFLGFPGGAPSGKKVRDTWVPVTILLVGWGMIVGICVLYYGWNRSQWKKREGDMYVWGFLPENKVQEQWWIARRPRPVKSIHSRIKHVSSGGQSVFTAVVTSNGLLYTVGLNDHGQLGHNDDTYRYLFSPVLSLWSSRMLVRQVVCGGEHSLVLTDVGMVWSFGRGIFGQLGHGDFESQSGPKRIASLEEKAIAFVSAGTAHSLCVTEAGRVFTFGSNDSGQLGIGDVELKDDKSAEAWLVESVKGEKIVQGQCGEYFTGLVNSDGVAYVFGKGDHGQLGLGAQQNCRVPTKYPIDGVRMIACGGRHMAVLTLDKKVFVNGSGLYGQLGLGDSADKKVDVLSPVELIIKDKSGEPVEIKSADLGHSHTAVITSKGDLYMFGYGGNFQLGNNAAANSGVPIKIEFPDGSKIAAASCGRQHTTLVSDDGVCFTFGTANPFAGLGFELTEENGIRPTPEWLTRRVVGNMNATVNMTVATQQLSTSPEEAKALDVAVVEPGKVVSVDLTGNRKNGDIYDAPRVSSAVTSAVVHRENRPEYNRAQDIAAFMDCGANHMAVVTSEGKIFTAGSGEYGQLGYSPPGKYATTLQQIVSMSSKKVLKVSAGWGTTAFTTADGELYMCGVGEEGQLGLGANVKRADEPRRVEYFVKNNVKVVTVSMGSYHAACSSDAGDMYTWGNDGSSIDKFYRTLPKCTGLLGLGGTVKDTWEPMLVPTFRAIGQKVKQVACGMSMTLALSEDGKMYTSGWGWFACQGDGERKNHDVPTFIPLSKEMQIATEQAEKQRQAGLEMPVVLADRVVMISSGLIHNACLTESGRVYTWGMGGHAQLGHGDTIWQYRPKHVLALPRKTRCVDMCAGTYQTAVILDNGEVHIWGSYLLGGLGLGTLHTPETQPLVIGALLGRRNKKIALGNHFGVCV